MDRIIPPSPTAEKLILNQQLWEKMREDVERRSPQEACGLVPGIGDHAQEVIPITNQLQSSTSYRFDPHEQIEAFQLILNKGWELTAIYHSHPHGPQTPSPTDIEQAFYPESIYLIWSNTSQEWVCRGFLIQKGHITEIPVIVNSVD